MEELDGGRRVNEKDRLIKVPNYPATDFSREISQNHIVHSGVKIDWDLSKITY